MNVRRRFGLPGLQRFRRTGDSHTAAAPKDLGKLFRSIGIDRDYSALDLSSLGLDIHGWGSEDAIFEAVIAETRPRIVIEVGSWEGGSLLRMHDLSRRLGCKTTFIAVDTWLGGAEQWLDRDARPHLRLRGGYPTLFSQFIANLIAHDAVNDVFPMPMTSTAAARVLERMNVVADAIHVDGSHQADEVAADLENYWGRLREGGVMFGDDYWASTWPGVVQSVDAFSERHGLQAEIAGSRWLVRRS